MGCLSERYLREMAIEIPQVDKFYGKFNWKELLHDLGKSYHEELYIERTLTDRKSTRLNSSHQPQSRMPSSA